MEAQSELRQRFRGMVALYASAIRRLSAVYVPNAADRDDLFQEILLAVWQALPAFRGDASERTWLYRIAHNVALTYRRKSRRNRDREASLDYAMKDPRPGVDVRRLALVELVSQLPLEDRQLVTLYLEGASANEIEKITGILAGTVSVRLTRIRQHLATAFNRPGVTP
jgi:RNA polymerase sigma-70 factor (ECF subfamily)